MTAWLWPDDAFPRSKNRPWATPNRGQLSHGRRSQPKGRFAEQLTAGKVKFSFAKWIGIHVSEIKFVSRAGWRDRSPKRSWQPEPKQLLPRDQDWVLGRIPDSQQGLRVPRLFGKSFSLGLEKLGASFTFGCRRERLAGGNEREQKISWHHLFAP